MDSEGFQFKTSSCKKQCVEPKSPPPVPTPVPVVAVAVPPVADSTEEADDCTRFIGELEALRQLMKESSVCRSCKKGTLTVTLDTVCLATSINTRCSHCDTLCASDILGASDGKAEAGSPSLKGHCKSTDYAVNNLFVLAMMLSGDGGTESGRVMGLLDLPNHSSMSKSTFADLESRLAPLIIELTKELLEENLLEEIRLTKDELPGFEEAPWKHAVETNTPFPYDNMPVLGCSYDMGWSKRSSGRRYDSHSGHAAIVGVKTRLPISLCVLSKFCHVCNGITPNDNEPIEHNCMSNFVGSSGAMEPEALVRMTHALMDDHMVRLGFIVADDDSSIRAQMKWSYADWMVQTNSPEPPKFWNKEGKRVYPGDKGKLRGGIPIPSWLNDPAHRKKTLSGELYKLALASKEKSKGVNKVDCLKITKNFAYMTRQLSTMVQEKWLDAGKAVLEHHFDNHEYCGQWCKRKHMSAEQLKADGKQGKFYRSMEKDSVVYETIKAIVDKYITMDRLLEVGHGFDTQVNESLNNSISWCAPKNKMLSGSIALTARIYAVVGIMIVGYERFMTDILERLDIEVTEGTKKHMELFDEDRKRRQASSKKTNTKNKRQEKNRLKIAEQIREAEKKRRADGWYAPGEGFNTCLPVAHPDQCTKCEKFGHKTSRSKKCDMHYSNVRARAQVEFDRHQEEVASREASSGNVL